MQMINNIEARNNIKGKARAIVQFDVKINQRQQRLLDNIQNYDDSYSTLKKNISMYDLSALTAYTNVEFALFTYRNKRLIIRGNEYSVNVDQRLALKLKREGYKWSGHTHPGIDRFVLMPSDGDKDILKIFQQEYSVIYNSVGQFYVFGKE